MPPIWSAVAHGSISRVAFTLGGSNSDTITTAIARRVKATAHGLAFILEHPNAPPRALAWLKTEVGLALCVPKDEGALDSDLQETVIALAERFLAEIALVLPPSRPGERQAPRPKVIGSSPATTSTLGDVRPTVDAPSALLWRTS